MQGAGHFHKTTEDAADKPQKVIALGKVRKREERQVRRHAQMKRKFAASEECSGFFSW